MSTAPKVRVVDDEAETPSETIMKAVKKSVEVEDELGRTLKVRRLSALHKLDLSALLGADKVSNPSVVNMAALAYSVIEIDGEKLIPPNTYSELRVLIGRLDEEGLNAAGQAAIDHFGALTTDDNDPATAAARQEAARVDLKN